MGEYAGFSRLGEVKMINKELLEILVCPVSKGKLEYDEKENVLVCYKSRLKYPIEDDIPIMLPERAKIF